nr:MAG TPA: hypothetical protein [Caudoviricetes sp.]
MEEIKEMLINRIKELIKENRPIPTGYLELLKMFI